MRKRTSTIWKYFDYVDLRGYDGEVYANCKYCPRAFDTKRISTMMAHLKATHKQVYPLALNDRNNSLARKRGIRAKMESSKSIPAESKSEKAKISHIVPKIIYSIDNNLEEEIEDENHKSSLISNNAGSTLGSTEQIVMWNKPNISNSTIPPENCTIRDTQFSPTDEMFLMAVAVELEKMSDDYKDIVKEAIWHILCEVKYNACV